MKKKNKIYGVLGCGGKSSRLQLPFSKMLLPLPGHENYYPLGRHVVDKMESTGVDKIFFIHSYKVDFEIASTFSKTNHIHVPQIYSGFGSILLNFDHYCNYEDNDLIMFSLPDSIFSDNPFEKMLDCKSLTCCLFKSDEKTKVDRLSKNRKFIVKSEYDPQYKDSCWFWGNFALTGKLLKKLITNGSFDKYTEIGDILNTVSNRKDIRLSSYWDLGTYSSWNNFLEYFMFCKTQSKKAGLW